MRLISSLFLIVIFSMVSDSLFAEEVDNPAYKAWAACKTGTSVRLMLSLDSDGANKEEVMEKCTLVEVLPSMAVIDVELPGQKHHSVVEPAHIEKGLIGIPAKIILPPITISAIKADKDSVTIGEKTFIAAQQAVTVLTGPQHEAGTVKTWFSAEVPGGLLKFEISSADHQGIIHGTFLDFIKSDKDIPRPPQDLDDRTPQGLMRMVDRQLPGGGIKLSREVFNATSPEGRSFVEVNATLNLSIAKLEEAARKTFGEATSSTDDIDHLIGMGGCTRGEIETATVEIHGNTADVTFGENNVGPMIQVEGRWKFDADKPVSQLEPAELKSLLKLQTEARALAELFASELAAGKYKSESDFRTAIKTKMDKLNPPAKPETKTP